MRKLSWVVLSGALLSVLASGAALAQATEPVRQVSLQAQAKVEVAQDWLQLRLQYQTTGSQSDDVQRDVNDALSSALKAANRVANKAQASGGALAMRVRSGGSRVNPSFGNNRRIERWNGYADLILEGVDLQAMQGVATNLQPFVLVSSSMSISAALQDATEAALTLQAIQSFREKASAVAQAFGYKSYEVAQVQVSGNASSPAATHAMTRSAPMADASMGQEASLAVQQGWQWVSVNVGGSITMR